MRFGRVILSQPQKRLTQASLHEIDQNQVDYFGSALRGGGVIDRSNDPRQPEANDGDPLVC